MKLKRVLLMKTDQKMTVQLGEATVTIHHKTIDGEFK